MIADEICSKYQPFELSDMEQSEVTNGAIKKESQHDGSATTLAAIKTENGIEIMDEASAAVAENHSFDIKKEENKGADLKELVQIASDNKIDSFEVTEEELNSDVVLDRTIESADIEEHLVVVDEWEDDDLRQQGQFFILLPCLH